MTDPKKTRSRRPWSGKALGLAIAASLSLFVGIFRAQESEEIDWAPLNMPMPKPVTPTGPTSFTPNWNAAKSKSAAASAEPMLPPVLSPADALPVLTPADQRGATLGGGWKSRPGTSNSILQTGGYQELPQPINELPRRIVPAIPTRMQDPEALPEPREVQEEKDPKEPKELPPDMKDPMPLNPERNLLLGAARNAVKQGNYDQAITRFEEFFKRFGDDFDIRKEFAGVLAQAGRSEEALKQIQRLLTRKPDDLSMRVTAGDLNITLKRYREAIHHFQQALAKKGDRLDVAAKLARAHVFDENAHEALRVYDQKLSKLTPDDDFPADLPALLVDLEFLDPAIEFLLAQKEENPKDLEVLSTLVRAYVYKGDRDKANKTLEELTAKKDSLTKRRELADTLFSAAEYDIAGMIYTQVLQESPNDQAALIGLARVQLELYLPKEACALLKSFQPNERMKRLHKMTRAEYHQRVGEYLEAKQIYREFLRENESDYEARVALAALLEFIREDEKAKAEYQKIVPTHTLSHKARLGIASTLTQQRYFKDATEVAKALLHENCGDGQAMAQLVRTLGKMEDYDKAVVLAQGFLEANARNISASRAVRLALGKVLNDAHRPTEAAQVFENVLCVPRGRLPVAFYGLARALKQMGQDDKAIAVLHSPLSAIGGDNRPRLIYADLFYDDQEDAVAVEMTDVVLKWDADNLAALIRKVDALGRLARRDANIRPTTTVAEHILALSPTNVRAHLALARALGTKQAFPASAAAYERLIALDNDFFIPQRERARMFNSDTRFDLAQGAYSGMLHPTADEVLVSDLAGLSLRKPGLGKTLDPWLLAGLPGAKLEIELQKVFAACPDPELNESLNRVFLDYKARCADQNFVRLEAEVKDKLWLPLTVLPLEKKLLTIEPTNTAVWFDHGQTYSQLRMTPLAMQAYGTEVKIDPQARESAIAIERAGLEMSPQLHFNFEHFYQSGRDNLADITRTRYNTFVRMPCGDEEEYFQLGFSRLDLAPPDADELNGNIPSLRVQKKYCEGLLLLHGQFNWEDYRDRITDRLTFDVGGRWYFCDTLKFRGSIFGDNVQENNESLVQDIHRTGLRLGADYRCNRRLGFTSQFTYANYSDNNDSGELFLAGEYLLTFAPCELKAVLSTDILGFREQTIFAVPDQAAGAVHPYFAPDLFVYYEARMEYKQWLSRDYFVHSNQCWYGLQYGIGIDNSFNTYNNFRALLNYDVHPWLSIGADARYTTSDVYEASSLFGYLILRSPWCLW